MAKPTTTEIRNFLEGYCIDTNNISNSWIEARRDNFVIPFIERITRIAFSGVQTYADYVSGNGTNILFLPRRNCITLISVKYVLGGDNQRVLNLANLEFIAQEGILKAKRNAVETWIMPVFPKGDRNMLVTYTAGYDDISMPADIKESIIYRTASMILTFISSRSGGGDITIEGYSKSYGSRGKYGQIRDEIDRMSENILRKYITGVV